MFVHLFDSTDSLKNDGIFGCARKPVPNYNERGGKKTD
jgi:hypothetical protein